MASKPSISKPGTAVNLEPSYVELTARITRLEHEIELARNEFTHVLDNVGYPTRIINRDFTIRYINQAFAEMSGISSSQATGKKCSEIFASPFCNTTHCRLKKILDGENSIQIEIVRVRKDGTTIPCVVSAKPVRNSNGEITGVVETFRDITERRQLEEQIRESEERYRAVVELGAEAGEAIVMLQDINGREGLHTFVSDQWPRITGYSREELQQMSFFDLVHPRDLENSIARHRQKISGAAVPGLYELNIMRGDGVIVPIEITGSYTRYKGQNANVVYIRDISQRKQLEWALQDERDKYRSLFDDAPITLWELDYSGIKIYLDELRAQGISNFREYFINNPAAYITAVKLSKTVRWNQAHVELWELQGLDLLQGQLKQREMFYKYPENFLALRDDYIRLANGEVTFTKEETIRTAKENVKHIITRFTIAPGHEDTWDRVFASLTDITDRKNAEEELKQYRDNLELLVNERTVQLKEEIEQRKLTEEKLLVSYDTEAQLRKEAEQQIEQRILFTRALVHELRTPLTPLLAASEYLTQNLEGTQKEFANAVSRSALKLEHRVNEILDLSKGEVGLLKLKWGVFDPDLMLNNVIEDVKPMVERNGQHIKLTTTTLPAVMNGDEERLQQIMLNLVDNAVKYNRKNGDIYIDAVTTGNQLIITVKDEGQGIDPLDLQCIFEPYKTSAIARNNCGGLGIGLALSRMLVELHGGEIAASSQKGAGCTFRISIPVSI